MRSIMVMAVVVAGASACVGFTGAARVQGGPDGCRATCERWGMRLAGMVQLGEYSDGCICEVKREATSGSSSAVAPAAAAVYMRMVAESERRDWSPLPEPPATLPPPSIDEPPPLPLPPAASKP